MFPERRVQRSSRNLGIKPVSCTVANPQFNAILERLHDTIKTAMRTELHENASALLSLET